MIGKYLRYCSTSPKLSKFGMLAMFLMKLQLNASDEDIGSRFGVQQSTLSRNFHRVLDMTAECTKHLIKWPERDVLHATSYANVFSKILHMLRDHRLH